MEPVTKVDWLLYHMDGLRHHHQRKWLMKVEVSFQLHKSCLQLRSWRILRKRNQWQRDQKHRIQKIIPRLVIWRLVTDHHDWSALGHCRLLNSYFCWFRVRLTIQVLQVLQNSLIISINQKLLFNNCCSSMLWLIENESFMSKDYSSMKSFENK